MKNFKRFFAAAAVTGFVSASVFGQCNTNYSACVNGSTTPAYPFVSSGPPVSSCLDWFGPNTAYISMNITTSGYLNMLIDGNASSGFLDVAVFNIPAGQAPCTAIQNLSNEIGCNYASAASGCNQFGNSFPCASSVPAPYVTAGQNLMIVVENWSGSSSTYTLSLAPGGAQAGPPNPAITPVGPFCVTSGPVQLQAADMGGTWSGPGVSPTGSFNPATAGPGTHTINYSIGVAPCNANSSTTITVNSATVSVSPNQTICPGGSATLTASGAATYTWSPTTGLSPTNGPTVTASPAVTTTYTVTGTTAGCNSTANVTVTVGGAPAVNAVPNQTYCIGATAPATNFSGGAAGTVYNWTNSNPAIGLPASGTGALPSFSAATAGTATITVTPTIGACTGTPISFTITVDGTNTTVSPDVSICTGSTPLSAGGAVNYSWSPTTGLSPTNGPNVTASPATTTTYTVTGTTAAGTCPTTATVTVTVGGNPTVNAVNAQTFCSGVTAPATLFSGSAGATFNWTNSNTAIGLAASGSGNLPSYTATNTTGAPITATITVTPVIGNCTGTPISFTITVNPQPSVIANNNGPLCEGEQIDLTASNVSGGTYSWSGPNAFSANAQNASIPNAPASSFGTYTVTVTAFGCSASATTTVAMNPGTQPVITPVGPFCENASAVTLTASVPGGTWSGPGITNPATGEFTPSSASIGNNTVTYTTASGCVNPATSIIAINPIPNVQFSSPVTSGCVPLTVTFADLTVPGSSSAVWEFGDASSSNQAGPVTHEYTAPGCYDVTLTSTSAAGCTNSLLLANYICALPVAQASFTVNDMTQTINDPTFQLINTSQDATIYTWEFGDGGGSSEMHPSHTYDNNPGSYTITLFADNVGNCPDSAMITVKVEDELVFHVPNAFTPDGDEHNNTFQPIFYSGFDPSDYTLTIYNRWGELIFESHNAEIGWDGGYMMNGEGQVKEGTYTWQIRFHTTKGDEKEVHTGHVLLIR